MPIFLRSFAPLYGVGLRFPSFIVIDIIFMRTEGTLRNWNDDRGFGFVVTSETKQDVFVHVSSFPQTGRRPQPGERLAFSIETDHDGKKRAVAVSYLDPPSAAALMAMRNAERPTPVATPRTASASTRHTRRPRSTERHRRADERSSGRIGGLVVLLAAVAAGAAIVRRDAIETYLPSSPVSTSVSTSVSAMPAAGMPAAERSVTTTTDVAPPAPTAFVSATSAASAPVASSFSDAAAGGFRCDGRTHCSQMTSCAEARYFLANCPGAQMDGNGDGDPCEQQWCH